MIKKADWIKVVERRGQSVLISSYFYNGIQTKYFKKILGLNIGLDHYMIVDYSNYYVKSEVERFQKMMGSIFQASEFGYLHKALEILMKKAAKVISFSKESGKNSRKSDLEVFKKFSMLCLEFGPAMYFPILVEKQVEEEVKKIISTHTDKDKEQIFSLLTRSSTPTENTRELISIYEIALNYCKNGKKMDDRLKNLIKNHLNNFGWLSFTKFVGDPWTEESILKRISNLNQRHLLTELLELKKRYVKQKHESLEAMNKLGFTKKEMAFIKSVQLLTYFRTFRLDAYTKAGFHMKSVFENIAEKLGLTLQELVFLTYQEIEAYLKKNKKFPKELAQKRINGMWQLSFFQGKMKFSYEPPFMMEVTKESKQTIIKGQVASTGFAKGEVRIIRGVKEFNKMIDKAVIVTSMTTPDFVPIMQRASAIVTDEGGITSHAAIVSRELKVPCITGTKTATKVLKDGDIVEVDAIKGEVKIIK